jgi:hypothetical protein
MRPISRAILLLMTTQPRSVPLHPPAQRPSQVEIVVLVHSHPPQRRERIRETSLRCHRVLTMMLVLVAAASGVLASAVILGETGHAHRPINPLAREAGAAGVAGAYGHHLRCLSITIAPDDSAYARADFNRAVPCGRYAGYATAIFHRVRGVWRPVLDSLHYSCPAAGVPRALQADLGVCP